MMVLVRMSAAALCTATVGLAASLLLAGAGPTRADSPPHLDPAYHNYQPPYPDTAQINGEQGNIVLDVLVLPNGKVRNVRVDVSSGFADLDNAAIEGVMGWRFIPAIEDGDAVTRWTKVTIVFRLPTAPLPEAAPAH